MRNGIVIDYNGIDISKYMVISTLKKSEILNNNKNTCNFSLVNYSLQENTEIVVRDVIFNIQQGTAGTDYMYFNDVYDIENKYPIGGKIILDVLGVKEEKTISAVDTVSKKLTFTTNLLNTYPVKTNCGLKFFGGIIDRIDQVMLSKSSTDIQYNYSLVGYEKLIDRKVVIDSYDDMFSREILGRIVYDYVANDSAKEVFDFGSTLTGSGVGNTTSNYSTDKIQGTYCQKATTTGAGTATRTKTLTSMDLSSYTDFRFWQKTKLSEGSKISSFSVRIGQDASNYYERNILHIGVNREDLWNYESFKLAIPDTTVGTPNLTAVVRLQYVMVCTGAVNYVLFDYSQSTTGGVTLVNTKKGTQKFEQLRFKGKNPSYCIENVAKQLQHFRYIDYDRDLHYYYSDGEIDSAFQITPTVKNYSQLNIKIDTSQIVNRQLVEGSDAPSSSLYEQHRKSDGVQTSFDLDYKPAGARTVNGVDLQGLLMWVDGVSKTVGPEGIADPSLYQFLFNFSEKVVRNSTEPTLASGKDVKFTYYPYKTISVRYADTTAIDAMKALVGGDGIFDGQIIIDKTIENTEVARQRAYVEVQMKKNPIVSYVFRTDINGIGLGQMIYVNDPTRSVAQKFQVQKITTNCIIGNMFSYLVEVTTVFFGFVEFFQLLLKKAGNTLINDTVDVIVPVNVDDDFTISDSITVVKNALNYFAGSKYTKFYWFYNETGISTSNSYIGGNPGNRWYFLTSASLDGTGQFTTDSSYVTGKVLQLVNNYSTSGKRSKNILMKSGILASLDIDVYFWLKVVSIGSGSGTIKLYFREYDNTGAVLATQTITVTNLVSDYAIQKLALVTNANTVSYDVVVEINELVATVNLAGFMVVDNSVETVTNPGHADFSFAS